MLQTVTTGGCPSTDPLCCSHALKRVRGGRRKAIWGQIATAAATAAAAAIR